MRLEPLPCTGCAAPLPLAVPAPEVACPFCGAANALPATYVEAADLRRRAAEARRAAEPLWQALDRGAPRWARWLGLVLVVVLPPLATLVAGWLAGSRLGAVAMTAVVTLPALLPGAALWIWSAAVAGITQRFHAALAARPAEKGRPPGCRGCGAPLVVEPGALAASCGYCGTDSLLVDLPVPDLSRELDAATTTLEDAARQLRTRRASLALGAAGVAVLVGGAAGLLWLAVSRLG